MKVNYNKIAKWFSDSRKEMKWEEIDYFISNYLKDFRWKNILDVWCGSARLLEQFSNIFDISQINYLWLDLSKEMLKYAKNNFPQKEFQILNMNNLDKLKWKKYDFIFFIASFHHLDNFDDRLKVLNISRELLNDNWIIFMTNWALNSEKNHEKYKNNIILHSENNFWSIDYNIYFWEYARYYHCFSLEELEYLFKENNFKIIENREFDNKRNFLSIIKKNWD